MNIYTLTQTAQCNNCQRLIPIGETVSAESAEAIVNGAALCSNCRPVDEKQQADKPEKKSKGSK